MESREHPPTRSARILVTGDDPLEIAAQVKALQDAGFSAEPWAGSETDARVRDEERMADQAALIDEARDAIYLRSLDDRVIFWNKGAQRLYGQPATEALGANFTQLVPMNPAAYREAREIVQETGSWTGEMEVTLPSGTLLIVDARWTLLRDGEGRPKSILTIDTDITQRKTLERQFLRAQRLESIGTLAAGIAHDLNNLLAPIVIGVDLLRLYGTNAESEQVIANIELCARRGANLVSQVMSFARGADGSRVSVQLAHVVREIQGIVSNTFPKNIRLDVSLPRDLWIISGDPVQLNQVLLNLCVNARDAMPEGGTLTLAVRNIEFNARDAQLQRGARPGRYVLAEVADDGVGMSREVADRIFEPFFTTKEIGKGTGLGLSTVMGVVRGHGGFLEVRSAPGKGSVFQLFFPVEERKPDGLTASTATTPLPRGNGELVLVVDDEEPILVVTRQTLEAFGYRVATARDGAQALKEFARQSGQVAVVLTDMMMPVMDGPALIAALMHLNPALPLVAASGLKGSGDLEQAAVAGARHFLSKPYTTENLLRKLDEVLKARR